MPEECLFLDIGWETEGVIVVGELLAVCGGEGRNVT